MNSEQNIEQLHIEKLHDDRERSSEALRRLDVFYDRRNAAQLKLSEIDAEIDALDRAERQSVEAWADGASAEAPKPWLAERRDLLSRRLDAEAKHRAAIAGAAAVEGRRNSIIAELTRIRHAILQHLVSSALESARDLHRQAQEIAQKISAPLQEIDGIRQSLITALNDNENARDEAAQGILGSALSQLAGLERPIVLGNPDTLAEYVLKWRRRLR